MFVAVLTLGLAALASCTPVQKSYDAPQLQDSYKAPSAAEPHQVASQQTYPYYAGYPFYHSGYPFYHGHYPYHYAAHFPAYFPYYAPVLAPVSKTETHGSSYKYQGKFDGTCVSTGLYYVDRRSFAFCSNGQRTVQSCAEGSANPEESYFENGKQYTMNEFCSVNLLAYPADRVNNVAKE